MTFKDAYLEDLDEVFFDEEEFASEHTIDGVPMTVVLINTTLEGAKKSNVLSKTTVNPKENAVNKSIIILYIKEKDAKRKFTANAMINLDGKKLFIHDVSHFEGVYKLSIGTHMV